MVCVAEKPLGERAPAPCRSVAWHGADGSERRGENLVVDGGLVRALLPWFIRIPFHFSTV